MIFYLGSVHPKTILKKRNHAKSFGFTRRGFESSAAQMSLKKLFTLLVTYFWKNVFFNKSEVTLKRCKEQRWKKFSDPLS